MKKFIHIGFPKAASTSLQMDVFMKHPSIYYLGRGFENFTNYIDDDVQVAAEIDLRFRAEYEFDSERFRSVFEKHFDAASKDSTKTVVGFSSEFFSFNFPNDIDVATKAERLKLAFGEDVSVLIVIREQFSFIRSKYKEFVRNGYARQFSEFIQWLYEQKDRNFFSALKYDKVYEKYASLFGAENVHIVPFEMLKKNPEAFMNEIGNAIGLDVGGHTLLTYNEAFSDQELEVMRMFNVQAPSSLSNDIFTGIHQLFAPAFYKKELGVAPPARSIMDAQLLNALQISARRIAANASGISLNMSANESILEVMRKEYGQHNRQFQEISGVDLGEFDYSGCVPS